MHSHSLANWQHKHEFSINNEKGEQNTRYVLILTAVTMVVEIIAGSVYGSMALLADGWHMSTHVAAFLIALFAYHYARKHAANPAYSFGTGKVNVLGGFASAIALTLVAVVMLVESLHRIITPQTIHFNEAILVASIGLLVNIASAFILKDHHHHEHEHAEQHTEKEEEHEHHHAHDHNLQAAYLHVLADALTSVLAIVALLTGKFYGWNWLDPVMGVVGAVIITRWSYGLLRQTSPILLDASIERDYQQAIKNTIENDTDNKITDIHIWKISANDYAVIISLVTHFPKAADYYKQLLQDFHKLSHITIEVNECRGEPCTESE